MREQKACSTFSRVAVKLPAWCSKKRALRAPVGCRRATSTMCVARGCEEAGEGGGGWPNPEAGGVHWFQPRWGRKLGVLCQWSGAVGIASRHLGRKPWKPPRDPMSGAGAPAAEDWVILCGGTAANLCCVDLDPCPNFRLPRCTKGNTGNTEVPLQPFGESLKCVFQKKGNP